MSLRRSLWLTAGFLVAVLLLFLVISQLFPLNLLSVQQKPNQLPQQLHDYYVIIDEATGVELMYVPLVVSSGDEVITENDKRYTVVRIEENRAYARFVEDVSYKQDQRK